MGAQENKTLIQQINAEIVQGNVETLMAAMSDEMVWEIPNPENKLAIQEEYKGHEGTIQLLQALGTLSEVVACEPQEYIAEDDTVVVIIHEESRSKATGAHFEQDMVHVWSFSDGKITRCRIFEDTYTAVKVFGS